MGFGRFLQHCTTEKRQAISEGRLGLERRCGYSIHDVCICRNHRRQLCMYERVRPPFSRMTAKSNLLAAIWLRKEKEQYASERGNV